jgi:hypothetical protein
MMFDLPQMVDPDPIGQLDLFDALFPNLVIRIGPSRFRILQPSHEAELHDCTP